MALLQNKLQFLPHSEERRRHQRVRVDLVGIVERRVRDRQHASEFLWHGAFLLGARAFRPLLLPGMVLLWPLVLWHLRAPATPGRHFRAGHARALEPKVAVADGNLGAVEQAPSGRADLIQRYAAQRCAAQRYIACRTGIHHVGPDEYAVLTPESLDL